MKTFFMLFLAIFLVSCGQTQNKTTPTTPENTTISTENITTKTETPTNTAKKYTLTLEKQSTDNAMGYNNAYKGNIQFSEETEDGKGDFEYNISILGNDGKLDALIVAYIPKDDELHSLIGFEDKMYNLWYAIADNIAIWTDFSDIANMKLSEISEHEILAAAIQDAFKQISQK